MSLAVRDRCARDAAKIWACSVYADPSNHRVREAGDAKLKGEGQSAGIFIVFTGIGAVVVVGKALRS